MARYTAMFYLTRWIDGAQVDEPRLFIGTLDEAVDELEEEIKEFHTRRRFDRRQARMELGLSAEKRTDVIVYDRQIKRGDRVPFKYRMERYGAFAMETDQAA